jgi:AcrR family transcriptional regulator
MKRARPLEPAAASRRPRGRPRCFDCDQALDRAIEVFWARGYDGASLADLTKAMGINPPSLYAAFGDKEGLFIQAVRRYRENLAQACPFDDVESARGAMESALIELATIFTDRSHPPGCLAVMAMTTSPAASPKLQKFLAEQRADAKVGMRERVQRGVHDGELPADTDVTALVNFYVALIDGMSLQAREGATRKTLLAMIEAAMRAWPEAPKRAPRTKVRAAA